MTRIHADKTRRMVFRSAKIRVIRAIRVLLPSLHGAPFDVVPRPTYGFADRPFPLPAKKPPTGRSVRRRRRGTRPATRPYPLPLRPRKDVAMNPLLTPSTGALAV